MADTLNAKMNIGLDIVGGEEALSQMKAIEAEGNKLSRQRINIRASIDDVTAKIRNIERQIETINNKKAEIKLDITASKSRIKELEQQITVLQNKISNIKYPEKSKNVQKWTAEIKKLQAEIEKETKSYQKQEAEVRKLEKEITNLNKEKTSAKSNKDVLVQEDNALKNQQATLRQTKKEFKEVADAQKKMGLEGKASAYLLASLYRNLGNILISISKLNPFSNILSGAMQTLSGNLSGMLTEGIDGAIERYDKLRSAQLTLTGLFGDGAKQTARISKAIDELDKSVIGLPTTLDDIVDSAKQYISITGDIEKGTKMAIATNRAFLASGADSEQVYHGTKQLYDLMSAGKLRTQEWESLFKAMPLAMRKVADEMGYTGKKFGDFRSELKSGEISAEDFMNTLIKLGYETDGSIYKLAENSKKMLSSVMINWKTAIKRGFANTIQTFNELSQEMTGKELTENLISFSGKIDEIFAEIQLYIKDNKEVFADWGRTLMNFPIKEFVEGVGSYVKVMSRFYKMILDIASKNPKLFSVATMFAKPVGEFIRSALPLFVYGKVALGDLGIGLGKVAIDTSKGASMLSKAGGAMKKGATAVKGGMSTLLESSFIGTEAKVALGVVIADLTAVITGWSAKTTASGIKKAIEELITGFNELKDFNGTEKVKMKIEEMIDMTSSLYEFLTGKAGEEAMTDASAGKKIERMMNGMSSTIKPLVDVSKYIKQISENSKDLDAETISTNLTDAVVAMKTALDDIGSLDTSSTNERTITTDDVEQFAERVKNVSDAVNNMKSIASNVKGVNWDDVSTKLQEAITGLETALGSLDIEGTKEAKGETFSSPLQNRVEAFKGIASSLADASEFMKKIYSNVSAIDQTGDVNVGSKISEIITSLTDELSNLNMETLKSKATELFTISNTIKSAMSMLKKSVQGTKGKYGFDGLAESIQSCIDKIEALNDISEVTVKVSLTGKDTLISKVDTIISKLNEIPKEKTTTVRVINITDTSRRRWNATTKQWEYFHTGGFVKPLYRANGGSIFRPRGTDRIPAMLTEGEFVMKRSAVQKFGLAFMNRLNNMDITGALKSLSIRSGMTTNNQRTVNTVHNDNRKENKVTVNQYMRDGGIASFKAGKALRGI